MKRTLMKTANEIDYATIVKPEEMQDARQWLKNMLDAVSAEYEVPGARPQITCIAQGWGELRTGMSISDNKTPLCLAGKNYSIGLGTHADSEILVRLPAGGRRLTGLCGVDDNPDTRGLVDKNLVFSIEAGGQEIWRSGPQNAASTPAFVDVPLAGHRQFTLKVKGPINFAHADWVDLKVALSNGQNVPLGKPTNIQTGFSFQYGGKPSAEFLSRWSLKKQKLPKKDGVILHRITRTDPKTGLAVICEIKEYTRFPVVEWSLRFKNTSSRKTPLIEDIRSMDITRYMGRFPYLNYWTGDYYSPDGYESFRVSLAHEEEYRFAPAGGRPTDRAWPYYNIECPTADCGMIAVVGWAGQWASSFRGLDTHAVHITAGQETTHFKLLPGEEVRTPLSLLMFYHGDRTRSRNLWRRWYLAHVMPRPGGELMKPHLACVGTDEGEEFTAATEENQIRYVNKFKEHGIHPDVWWIDAGWYPCYDKDHERRWTRTGTWEPDPERFPRGLKPVSDDAAREGADLLVWFEPERVTPGSRLDMEHPEWLLKIENSEHRLLNLGNSACRRWLTNHVCRLIKDNGIKIYRQDFNFPPLEYWRRNDAPDRQGMTENLHVQGYYRYWDELLVRNPGLWIDSCSSGGRRNDLETMRRSVPLHYSDYGYGDHPIKLAFQRTMHEWIPYFKECTLAWDIGGAARFDQGIDSYSYHCAMAPMMMPTLDIRRDDYDFALVAKMIEIWRRAAGLKLYGDYYPLTPYHRSPDQWVVWQFDCPDEGRGLIQAFRLPSAPGENMVVRPEALAPDAIYRFENPETGEIRQYAGHALQEEGFIFTLPKRQAAIWFYELIKQYIGRLG